MCVCEQIVPEIMKKKMSVSFVEFFHQSFLHTLDCSNNYCHCQVAAFNLTLMMTSAQVVKSSITIKSSPEESANN